MCVFVAITYLLLDFSTNTKMERLNRIMFGILILQIYVNAAPSSVGKVDDIAEVIPTDVQLDDQTTEELSDKKNSTNREKRMFNPYGLGFPPISPLIYPTKRDELPTGVYGFEDPLAFIHRRVEELANYARQPPPPPIPQIPFFFPVLFVPPLDCLCGDISPTKTPDRPTTGTDETALPTVTERLPPLDDERQNWGFVTNDTDDDTQDFESRPISFDPIRLDKPLRRPPPPVEHGSVQGDSMGPSQPPSTESSSTQTPEMTQPPQTSRAPVPPYPPAVTRPPLIPPSPCEGAVLTCCHQPQVVYQCFALQGCPDFTYYGNPCNALNILKIISRFQEYYGQRNG